MYSYVTVLAKKHGMPAEEYRGLFVDTKITGDDALDAKRNEERKAAKRRQRRTELEDDEDCAKRQDLYLSPIGRCNVRYIFSLSLLNFFFNYALITYRPTTSLHRSWFRYNENSLLTEFTNPSSSSSSSRNEDNGTGDGDGDGVDDG